MAFSLLNDIFSEKFLLAFCVLNYSIAENLMIMKLRIILIFYYFKLLIELIFFYQEAIEVHLIKTMSFLNLDFQI